MKTVKPQRLGLLHRVFEDGADCYLSVTVLGFFPFDAPEQLLPEVGLWKCVASELGRDAPLDVCMPKTNGELVLTAKGYPLGGIERTACSVRAKLGTIDKTLWVVGDRTWSFGVASEPVPFREMPITYGNAFGGEGFAKNPLGKGFSPIKTASGETHPLPNVEDPKHLVHATGDRPAPAGFGAYDITWPQRHSKVGTYDAAWLEERFPGFARDMDWTIFNTAPDDQQIDGHFQGDEAFTLENMHPDKPMLEGKLPGLRARVFIHQKTGEGLVLREIVTHVDTVHLFPHLERGIVIHRGTVKIAQDDAADVLHIVAGFEKLAEPRPADHYREVLDQRLDKKKGYLFALRDKDLMPPGIEPSKARPEDGSDIDQMLARDHLLEKNIRAKTQRELDAARERLLAQGLDASQVPASLPPETPTPDVEHFADFVQQAEADLTALEGDAKKKFAEAEAEARRACTENGLDYDTLVAEAKANAGGPPTFRADVELERLRGLATLGENAGVPLPHVQAQLADPELARKLRTVETMLRDAYRRFAHHQPAAGDRGDEAATRLRDTVERGAAAGVSFADQDLTGADLSKLDLRGVDFRGAFLERARLAEADLSGADLTNAVLARADLAGAKLDGARLAGANFGHASLVGASVTGGVDATGAVFAKADLTKASFAGAKLGGADLAEATFGETDFSGVEAKQLNFVKSNLAGLALARADLTKCNFVETNVAGVDFSGAKLVSSVFVTVKGDGALFRDAVLENLRVVKDSSFERAVFAGANLDGANLRGTKLAGADFEGARMQASDFSECDLTGANLRLVRARDAKFIRTDLTRADLSGADLMQALLPKAVIAGATFHGANLFRADLLKVRVDGATNMKSANLKHIRYVEARRPNGQG